MAKHRRAKSNAPVDYGMTLAIVAAVAGALAMIRWFIRRVM